MRTVWAADNPSPDRSSQIASRRWYSGQRSEPFKHNNILIDSYILTKGIGSPVNADHEVPGIRVLSRAAFGAPTRRWKPCKWVVGGLMLCPWFEELGIAVDMRKDGTGT